MNARGIIQGLFAFRSITLTRPIIPLNTYLRRSFHSKCVSELCKMDFMVPKCLEFKYGYCPRCGNPVQMKPIAGYTSHLEYHRTVNSEVSLPDDKPLGITGTPTTGKTKLTKASLGSENTVPWSYAQNTIECMRELKKMGTKFLALETGPQSTYFNTTLQNIDSDLLTQHPISFIVGNEVEGVSQEALSMADWICHLPMKGGNKKSLNVSVAFGIAAYQLSDKFNAATIK